jgi:hypothetical protein
MSAEQPASHDPRIFVPGEQELNAALERTPITMESLWTDNHSQKAQRRRARFDEDEKNHRLVTIFRCSDSRYIITYRGATTISTIAAGGPKKLFGNICADESSMGIIALPHESCGGLGSKSVLEQYGLPDDADEVARYLNDPANVPTSDPGAMALLSARNISRIIPDKPVLAAVHNHSTGNIFPLVTYYRGQPVFQEGIPSQFESFFAAQRNYVTHLRAKLPNLEAIQAEQNAGTLVLTRSRRPLESILPEGTRIPGRVFRILSSRPEDGDVTRIDPEDEDLVIGQSHYPFAHFSALNRVLVLTENMDTSREMTRMLLNRPWTRTFAAKPDTAVYIGQSRHGVIEDIDDYPLGRAA